MDKLGFIAEQMKNIGILYEFGEFSQNVRYPYFVGEITEDEPETEDGKETSTMILTGFQRGKRLPLEQAKKKIRNHFHPVSGLIGETEDGVIAIFYAGASYIPTGEMDLQKIQINLKIIEWKVE